MSTISTHVLDTVLGKPAAGIGVRLEKQESGGWGEGWIEVTHLEGESAPSTERARDLSGPWSEVSRSATDADGRCSDLAQDLPAGVYRLVFDTGSYLNSMHRTSIYPEIAITFSCAGEGQYHLPLLLSDNGYTTYRGS